MPKIPQYEQQIRVNRGIEGRNASPSDFNVGQGISRLGESVGNVGELVNRAAEQKDLSTLHADLATARADAAEELRRQIQTGEINADDALDKYNNFVSERVSQAQNKMSTRGGQAAATSYGTTLAQGLREKAFEMKAAADGALAVDNFKQAQSKNGAAVYNDPTQFNAVLRETEALINDPAGPYVNRLPADKRRELLQNSKDELAILAARGTIDNAGPKVFQAQRKAGQWDGVIPADKLPILDGMAETAIRAEQADEDRAYSLAERAKKDADEKLWGSYLQRMEKPDLGGLTFKEIVTSSLDPQVKEHLMGVLKQRIKNPDAVSNPQVYLDVQRKIYLPPDDPEKIDDPRVVMNLFSVNKQLSHSDLQSLLGDIEKAKTQDGLGRDLQSLAGQVHATFMRSPMGQATGADLIAMGDTAMYNWRKDAEAAIDKVRADGGDPRQTLLNPKSKEYLASPERLSTYLGTAKSTVADAAAKIKSAEEGTVMQFAQGWGVFRKGRWEPISSEKAAELQKAAPKPAALKTAPEQSLEIAFGYIESKPRSASVTIDAPARLAVSSLNGKVFASREEAQQAIRDLLK